MVSSCRACYPVGDIMGTTHFLINESIWQAMSELMKSAKHVDAVIAYFGDSGARLLPLQEGHRLVVDMSQSAVKAGSTDPFEIEKLMKRDVLVFTRRNLHAKIVIADDTVLVGSANISRNSRDNLDEAAILTKDSWVLKQACEFFDRLCTEPVRDEYLEQCKGAYRPPRIPGQRGSKAKGTSRARHAKLWVVNLIDYRDIPQAELDHFEESEQKALELIKDTSRSSLHTFHWPYEPKMADELEPGDWIIQCIRHEDKSITVWPPGQFLWLDHYIRNSKTKKERYVFHLEMPRRGQTMDWKEFSKAMKSIMSEEIAQPRTRPIRDAQHADDLLRLWTPRGRIAKH